MGLSSVTGPVLLALGFGFVIFWHELGHFLAAKWVGIKVEQFAVGFGKAVFAWRKGLGFRLGSTRPDYEKRIVEHVHKGPVDAVQFKEKVGAITPDQEQQAAKELGISETEYRLNWIPLGGYVKMLGQDDMNPNAQSPDPRSFNRKSIGARMIVVSAGVIMNIIMAMIGFAIVFRLGFDAPPAVVGMVVQGSPAQRAGLEVGDRIAYIDDQYQHDFTKLKSNIVLAGYNSRLKTVVEKPDGSYRTVIVSPEPSTNDLGFLSIGVGPAFDLIGPENTPEMVKLYNQHKAEANRWARDMLTLAPGDVIVAVNGKRLEATKPEDRLSHDENVRQQYFNAKRRNLALFDAELRASHGKAFSIIVSNGGKETEKTVQPELGEAPGDKTIRMAGMAPRSIIKMIGDGSPVMDKVLPGDVVAEISLATPTSPAVVTPTEEQLRETLNGAGNSGDKVNLKVERAGQTIAVDNIEPIKLESKKRGLNVGLGMELANAVVGTVTPNSAADRAGIPRGAKIVKINDQPVKDWFDVRTFLGATKPGQTVSVYTDGNATPYSLTLSEGDIDDINAIQLTTNLQLQSLSIPRQTNDTFKAMGWGVVETTSLLKQFYISLQRMVEGTISPKNMIGPVGIFASGTSFAERGTTWLIWFLCMISANLAVVNFLPIPIVDGGLFTFLIIEKIKGRPLSPKAQSVAQVVGLALLGFVFVFATYQDIYRLIYGWG